MNLLELSQEVATAINSAIEYGDDPASIPVSIQIEGPEAVPAWAEDIVLHYDNDSQASGLVLVGYKEEA